MLRSDYQEFNSDITVASLSRDRCLCIIPQLMCKLVCPINVYLEKLYNLEENWSNFLYS